MSRRGENIYKRKDGRWEARFIKGYDSGGKAKYCSVYAHSYGEVRLKLLKAKEGNGQKSINPTTLKVTEWFEIWMHAMEERVKPSTLAVYKRYYSNHIKPFFGGCCISRLNTEMLQHFVNSRNGLASSTVKGIFRFLRMGLQAAAEKDYILNVWEKVELPGTEKKPVRVFSRQEQEEIEKNIIQSDNPNGIGIIICLYTGLRIGEVCALMWQDINFKAGIISVRRTIQRISNDYGENKTKLMIMPPKSANSVRDIPVPEFLLKKLEKQRETNSNCQYVLNIDGKPIEPRTYQYQFSRFLEKNKIKHAKFHTTRHTFATRALETGMDIKTLSEILGHADASITMRRYAHSSDEQKRKSIEHMAEVIFTDGNNGRNNGHN